MKNIHDVVVNHRSIRKYKNQDIPEKDLKMILDAVTHAPTSINGQQCSVVVVKDQSKKDKIAEITGGQQWISQTPVFLVFVADYSRTAKAMKKKGLEFKNMESVEATMVGAVDCGIAFGSAMDVAESLGYGIVPIGAIRRDPEAMVKLLNLPEYTFPVLGMCIGVPDEMPGLKPRFGEKIVIHNEEYRPITDEELDQYDETILKYMDERTGGTDVRDWSDGVTAVYSKVYFPKVKPVLEKQGFKNEK